MRASRRFVDYFTKHSTACIDVNTAARLILNTFGVAHNQIMKGNEIYECGTTTLIAGSVFPVDRRRQEDPPWLLVLGSIGDCKVASSLNGRLSIGIMKLVK